MVTHFLFVIAILIWIQSLIYKYTYIDLNRNVPIAARAHSRIECETSMCVLGRIPALFSSAINVSSPIRWVTQ